MKNIKEKIILELKKLMDKELPINIYDLGLIYKIVLDKNTAFIEVTTINSRCSSTYSFEQEIKNHVLKVKEVDDCVVKFVFSPKWDLHMISKDGLEQLRNANK